MRNPKRWGLAVHEASHAAAAAVLNLDVTEVRITGSRPAAVVIPPRGRVWADVEGELAVALAAGVEGERVVIGAARPGSGSEDLAQIDALGRGAGFVAAAAREARALVREYRREVARLANALYMVGDLDGPAVYRLLGVRPDRRLAKAIVGRLP